MNRYAERQMLNSYAELQLVTSEIIRELKSEAGDNPTIEIITLEGGNIVKFTVPNNRDIGVEE